MFVPEQGRYRASSIQPRLLQLSVPDQSNRVVEADNRPFHLQRPCALPELNYENASVNPWNLQKDQWLTSQKLNMLTLCGRHTDLVHKFDTSVSHMLKSLLIECDIWLVSSFHTEESMVLLSGPCPFLWPS